MAELSAALLSTIKSLNKTSGRNFISLGQTRPDATPIPTGSLGLDLAIGIGGVPMGRVIEIYGPESSGKTSLSLLIGGSWYQSRVLLGQENRKLVFIDLERTTSRSMLISMGLDPDDLIWVTPDTAEEALQATLDLTKTGEVGMIILDSVDSLLTEQQLKQEVGDNNVGGNTKALNRFFREYSKLAADTNTTAIFINQIRLNPGAGMYGDPRVTPGGKALAFYASLRLQMMDKKNSDLPNAFLMRVKIIKNKVNPPGEEPVCFDFFYARGPDRIMDSLNVAKTLGVARSAGRTFKVLTSLEPKVETTISSTGGIISARQYYKDNPDELDKLRNICLQYFEQNKNTVTPIEDIVLEQLEE